MASYGDISMLSFFADKTVTMGEGGMLLSNDKKIIEEANIFKHDGRRERGHDLIERKDLISELLSFKLQLAPRNWLGLKNNRRKKGCQENLHEIS